MNLGDLIKQLEEYNPDTKVPLGFGAPHSYRGDYYSVAFEPVEVTTIREMLEHAKSALGATFTGYKGGEYTMEDWTTCYIAAYGCSGETIGPILLDYMADQY